MSYIFPASTQNITWVKSRPSFWKICFKVWFVRKVDSRQWCYARALLFTEFGMRVKNLLFSQVAPLNLIYCNAENEETFQNKTSLSFLKKILSPTSKRLHDIISCKKSVYMSTVQLLSKVLCGTMLITLALISLNRPYRKRFCQSLEICT